MSKCCQQCSCSQPRLITFIVCPRPADHDGEELLVILFPFGATTWPAVLQDLDERAGGRISSFIEQENFLGVLDEHLLIDSSEMNLSADFPRFLLLIGVGRAKPVAPMQLCCSFGCAAHFAVKLGVNCTTLALDGCDVGDPVKAGSILRCRFGREAEIDGDKSKLNLVRVVSKMEDSESIKTGLATHQQVCAHCLLPESE